MPNSNESLVSLQNVLSLLVEQAQAYERALPANNYAAGAAVASLMRYDTEQDAFEMTGAKPSWENNKIG